MIWKSQRPGARDPRQRASCWRSPVRSSTASARRRRRSAEAAATNDPGRGEAVAQFIDVLVGRLVGAGKGMIVVGIVLALAPGHDGGDLRHRGHACGRGSRRTARAGAGGSPAVWRSPYSALARPDAPRRRRLRVRRGRRAAGALRRRRRVPAGVRRARHRPHDQAAPQARGRAGARRHDRGIHVDGDGRGRGRRRRTPTTPQANPTDQGCNGYIELCAIAVNQIVWPASHNAMSSSGVRLPRRRAHHHRSPSSSTRARGS